MRLKYHYLYQILSEFHAYRLCLVKFVNKNGGHNHELFMNKVYRYCDLGQSSKSNKT